MSIPLSDAHLRLQVSVVQRTQRRVDDLVAQMVAAPDQRRVAQLRRELADACAEWRTALAVLAGGLS